MLPLQALAWALTLTASRPYTGLESLENPGLYLEVLATPELRGGVCTIAWTPDSRGLWVSAEDGALYLLDAGTAAISRRIPLPDEETLDPLVVSSDGKTLAGATSEARLLLVDVAGPRVRPLKPRHPDGLEGALAFSPDGALVFGLEVLARTRSADETILAEAWDVASGRSRGLRRLRYFESDGHDYLQPAQHAGHHILTDGDFMYVRSRPFRPCDGQFPYEISGDVGLYGDTDGPLRRIHDCAQVHPSSPALTRAAPSNLELSADGAHVAWAARNKDDTATASLLHVATDTVTTTVLLETTAHPEFQLAPDASQLALVLEQRAPDGVKHHVLVLWRPLARPGAPARRIDLHLPGK